MARSRSALAIAAQEPVPPIVIEDLCYQAQQAAEKALKAVCRSRGLDLGFTHDIGELTQILEDSGATVTEDVDSAIILTRYAVQTRYPGLYPPLGEADWREAVTLAQAVVQWAAMLLGMPADLP
jgi:HEPN domain-containing protein